MQPFVAVFPTFWKCAQVFQCPDWINMGICSGWGVNIKSRLCLKWRVAWKGARVAKRMAKKRRCREIAHSSCISQHWAVQIFMFLPHFSERLLSKLNNDFILAGTNQTDHTWISHLASRTVFVSISVRGKNGQSISKFWEMLGCVFLGKLWTKKLITIVTFECCYRNKKIRSRADWFQIKKLMGKNNILHGITV